MSQPSPSSRTELSGTELPESVDLVAVVAAQQDQIDELRATVEHHAELIEDLQRRLGG